MDLSQPRAVSALAGAEDADHWAALFAQVGAEVAMPLTAALERVHSLRDGGAHADWHVLATSLAQARRAAMVAQQLARLVDSAVRQNPERLDLASLLGQVVAEVQPRARARGTPLLERARAATVVVDASLMYAALHAMLDWALAHSCSALHLGIDHRHWPVRARLHLRFRHRPDDEVDDPKAPTHIAALDTLDWQLLRHGAQAMGLLLERADTACGCRLTLEFPRTVHEPIDGVSTLEIDTGFGSTFGSRALAGHHVLVLSARRELRAEVRDALRPLGLLTDFVSSVDSAREFCRGGAPHALVYDAQLEAERLRTLHAELRAIEPAPALIEVADHGPRYQASPFDAAGIARVGRATLADGLSAALMFELMKPA